MHGRRIRQSIARQAQLLLMPIHDLSQAHQQFLPGRRKHFHRRLGNSQSQLLHDYAPPFTQRAAVSGQRRSRFGAKRILGDTGEHIDRVQQSRQRPRIFSPRRITTPVAAFGQQRFHLHPSVEHVVQVLVDDRFRQHAAHAAGRLKDHSAEITQRVRVARIGMRCGQVYIPLHAAGNLLPTTRIGLADHAQCIGDHRRVRNRLGRVNRQIRHAVARIQAAGAHTASAARRLYRRRTDKPIGREEQGPPMKGR